VDVVANLFCELPPKQQYALVLQKALRLILVGGVINNQEVFRLCNCGNKDVVHADGGMQFRTFQAAGGSAPNIACTALDGADKRLKRLEQHRHGCSSPWLKG